MEKLIDFEMIHPARFLFNAGSTPKQWNEQILHDPHLKVLYSEQETVGVRLEKGIFERLSKFCKDSGQPKTVAVESIGNVY